MVINEYTDFDSAINKVNTLSSGLKTIGTNFSNAMTDIESKLAGVSFAGWEDGISTKMQSALEDYKTNGINSINTDLASGGFYTLTKKVSDVYDDLVGCKNISSEKKNLEYFLSSS